jgi:hypothetical protein
VFRSDAQLARVCRAFCARARLGRLWTEAGPTDEAMALLQSDGGPLSSGERMVILIAWSLWNGQGHVTVADALHRLDGMSLAMLGKLMVAGARGSEAIDAWLAETEESLRRGHA